MTCCVAAIEKNWLNNMNWQSVYPSKLYMHYISGTMHIEQRRNKAQFMYTLSKMDAMHIHSTIY